MAVDSVRAYRSRLHRLPRRQLLVLSQEASRALPTKAGGDSREGGTPGAPEDHGSGALPLPGPLFVHLHRLEPPADANNGVRGDHGVGAEDRETGFIDGTGASRSGSMGRPERLVQDPKYVWYQN